MLLNSLKGSSVRADRLVFPVMVGALEASVVVRGLLVSVVMPIMTANTRPSRLGHLRLRRPTGHEATDKYSDHQSAYHDAKNQATDDYKRHEATDNHKRLQNARRDAEPQATNYGDHEATVYGDSCIRRQSQSINHKCSSQWECRLSN